MQLSNRLVKDDFWTDTELMENLPPIGRMFYQGLWQLAEETGVLENDPLAYKIQLFPADSEVTVEKIKKWVDALVEMGKLIEFSDNEDRYFYIKNFHKHQSFSHPPEPGLPLPDFIKYIPNPGKYKAGAYEIHWRKVNGSHEKGIGYIGEPPESYEKLTGNTRDSHEKDTSNEIEVESESESESESEKEGNKSDSKSSSPAEKYNEYAPTTSRGLDYDQIKELWNDRVPEDIQIRTITDKRKKHLRARYKEPDFALGEIITAIQEQPFLLGDNDRGWEAGFTWVIKSQDNYTNILERTYKDNDNKSKGGHDIKWEN